MRRNTQLCPRCKAATLFYNKEKVLFECYDCGFNMNKITLGDLKNLYFKQPTNENQTVVKEGDRTNWEFYWAINHALASLGHPLVVAGWVDDNYTITSCTADKSERLFFAGETVEETVFQFLRMVLHAASRADNSKSPSADQHASST